jgi:hypothetical protein
MEIVALTSFLIVLVTAMSVGRISLHFAMKYREQHL